MPSGSVSKKRKGNQRTNAQGRRYQKIAVASFLFIPHFYISEINSQLLFTFCVILREKGGGSVLSEEELIVNAKNGDKHSFEALVLMYRHRLTAFANTFTGDYHLAEDITQEAFAKVWLNLSGFKVGTSFKAWLFAIIRNLAIDSLRRNKREYEILDTYEADYGEPEATFLEAERYAALNKAIKGLPPDAKTAISLYAVEEMSYSEIAGVMGKSILSVKSLIFRARKKLKEERGLFNE